MAKGPPARGRPI